MNMLKASIAHLLCFLLKRKYFKCKKPIKAYGYEIEMFESWLFFERIFQITAPNGKFIYVYSEKCRPSMGPLSFDDLIKKSGFFPQNCKALAPLIKLLFFTQKS